MSDIYGLSHDAMADNVHSSNRGLNMVTFWSYLGWSLVGLTGVAYVFAFYRLVLFPRRASGATKQKASQVA